MKEITFSDVAKAKIEGNPGVLNEVSLGRVYQHAMKAKVKALGIMTAWRGYMSGAEKKAANTKLMQDIRSAGLGAFKLIGNYWECQDKEVAPEDCPKDKKELVKELSFGIVGVSKKQILKWCKKYDQECVIYLGPETDGDAVLLFQSGKEINKGKFNPNKIADSFSKVHGGTFVFEGFEYPAQSMFEKLIEDGASVIFSTK